MTYKEKAKEENPDLEGWQILSVCPEDLKLETETNCISNCEKCWNREMPDTEQYDEIKERLELIDELKQVEYNKGAKDVWEFIKKWCDMTHIECVDAFGNSSLRLTLDRYSPSEAIAKLKEYEDSKCRVKVGDVIKTPIGNAVVTKVSDDEYIGIVSSGEYVRVGGFVAKTGKHINLDSVLEQIGE